MVTTMEIREKESEDRLSNLPDDLKLRILSSLDAKHAVQTSLLSKKWVSLWTSIPVLEFNYHAFRYKPYIVFDEFVNKVLCLRDQSAKLDRLSFFHDGECNQEVLKNVLDYAFTHCVKELEVDIGVCSDLFLNWPVCPHVSSESLTSLKLQSMTSIRCPFLIPRSGSFKNLRNLYLTRPIITDLVSFSGFPNLESLTLHHCDIRTEGKILRVNAPNLKSLNISCYDQSFNFCELTTPILGHLRYYGAVIPLIRTHEDLPDRNTIGIDFGEGRMNDKRNFDCRVSLFYAFRNTKTIDPARIASDLKAYLPKKPPDPESLP